ncbi:stromal membrane-associated protein 1-like isoform X1 [Lates japonicus]|uniref:Stromal membrane-associated protein 1-like isoform X1 n=1 Tax=Lates japonicus TaxID=270547 RepID=A0AAD3NJ80_LATJO|nr:stromal membrane-associated protein 1-like isoform X1 [Lates japonicus]
MAPRGTLVCTRASLRCSSLQALTPEWVESFRPTTMMGGGAMMSGMALPNGGYIKCSKVGVMPANQAIRTLYTVQQGQQQGQWNMSQMTQQMSGMAVSSGGPTSGTLSQSGAPTAGWPAAPPAASGQTLSTQLWK